jgi:hypothetical protein
MPLLHWNLSDLISFEVLPTPYHTIYGASLPTTLKTAHYIERDTQITGHLELFCRVTDYLSLFFHESNMYYGIILWTFSGRFWMPDRHSSFSCLLLIIRWTDLQHRIFSRLEVWSYPGIPDTSVSKILQ